MATTRRRLLEGVLGAALLPVLAGCLGANGGSDGGDGDGGDGGETADADGRTVEVGPNNRYEFAPGTEEPLQISPGTTVRFVWESDTHNVHVTGQPDDVDWPGHDDIENTGFEFEYEFEIPGTYEFVCEPHESLGMTGTIVVDE